jgi:hypothetical protein
VRYVRYVRSGVPPQEFRKGVCEVCEVCAVGLCVVALYLASHSVVPLCTKRRHRHTPHTRPSLLPSPPCDPRPFHREGPYKCRRGAKFGLELRWGSMGAERESGDAVHRRRSPSRPRAHRRSWSIAQRGGRGETCQGQDPREDPQPLRALLYPPSMLAGRSRARRGWGSRGSLPHPTPSFCAPTGQGAEAKFKCKLAAARQHHGPSPAPRAHRVCTCVRLRCWGRGGEVQEQEAAPGPHMMLHFTLTCTVGDGQELL